MTPLISAALTYALVSRAQVEPSSKKYGNAAIELPFPYEWGAWGTVRRDKQKGGDVSIRVECYSGYRSEEEPLAFWLGERRLTVHQVVDRWFAPEQRWFKVEADDGNMYVLRHDEPGGEWEIVAFRRGEHHDRG